MSVSEASDEDVHRSRAGRSESNTFADISDDDSADDGREHLRSRSSDLNDRLHESKSKPRASDESSGSGSEHSESETNDKVNRARGTSAHASAEGGSYSEGDSIESRHSSRSGERTVERNSVLPASREQEGIREMSLRRPPSHRRTILDLPVKADSVSLWHMPPTIDVPLSPTDPAKQDLPSDRPYSILYRLRRGVSRDEVERAVDKHGSAGALKWVASSNTRLLTWSDGSRTLMIGDEHFAVADDRVVPPSLYIFRKGNEVQSFHAKVGHVSVVQPSTVSRKRGAMCILPDVTAVQKKSRVMLREMDGGAEREEQVALSNYHARMREQARLEARRRKLAEKQVRPEQTLSRAGLESEEESDDEAMLENHRLLEEERAARLRASKRMEVERHAAVQRRKLGARRVLSDDEDEED